MNLERLSQATIDIATHIVRVKKLGISKRARDLFIFLEQNRFLSKEISYSMQSIIGFRNIALHDYQNLNLDVVIDIIERHLIDFDKFIEEILKTKTGENQCH